MAPHTVGSVIDRRVLADRKIVPDEQLKIFCNILHFEYERGDGWREGEEGIQIYSNRIRSLLLKLRWPFTKPNRLERLILPRYVGLSPLCDAHKDLNAEFVHQWYKYLTLEVGARLEILRYSDRSDWAWHNVIIPCSRVNRMWLKPQQLKHVFGIALSTNDRTEFDLIENDYQTNECKACMLARIGSHTGTLLALETCIRSRITLESQRKHPTRLRLLRLIGPWLDSCLARLHKSPSTAAALERFRSTAEDLYETRQRLQLDLHARQRAVRQNSNLNKTEDPFRDPADDIEDAENDIIDSYAALRATQRASRLLSMENLNPGSVASTPSIPLRTTKGSSGLLRDCSSPLSRISEVSSMSRLGPFGLSELTVVEPFEGPSPVRATEQGHCFRYRDSTDSYNNFHGSAEQQTYVHDPLNNGEQYDVSPLSVEFDGSHHARCSTISSTSTIASRRRKAWDETLIKLQS